MSSGALLLPLLAAFGYACGAIAVKRSLGAGAPGSLVNIGCNVVMALFFQILWFFPGRMPGPLLLMEPVACGILFFIGQLCTFRALDSGDVSIAVPMLGLKVLLVALFSVFLIGKSLPASWWIASVFASAGVALISYSPGGSHRRLAATIGWSFAAAAVFALTDVLVQYWVPGIGYTRFAPVMFGTMGAATVMHLPALFKGGFCQDARCPAPALSWLTAGALLLGIQSLGMYSAIGLYGSAAMTNILYGSRSLWSVLLVWVPGSLVGSLPERGSRGAVMGRRLAGALMLFAAMALVLR